MRVDAGVRILLLLIGMLLIFVPAGDQRVADVQAGNPVHEWRKEMTEVCRADSSRVGSRVLQDYGAIFSAEDSVSAPPVCVFSSEKEVAAFQAGLDIKNARIASVEIELQEAAMDALLLAIKQAADQGLRISPRGGSIAARRNFADTVRLWKSRFDPALGHWVAKGRIDKKDADAARKMSLPEQAERVLEWESDRLFFSTGKNRSIMTSVAVPGTSQHLSLLAFDVLQAGNPQVRRILNENGWYQTVVDDSPHFTFLGFPEKELPARGLRRVNRGGFVYWVPDL